MDVCMVEKCYPEFVKACWASCETEEPYGVSGEVDPGKICLAGTEQHSALREDDRKWTRQAKLSRKSFCSFVIA